MVGAAPPLGSQTPRIAATRPNANPFLPPIPAPAANGFNLVACVAALKENAESLAGQRGDAVNRAVTFRDLVNYGILDVSALQSPHGSFGPPVVDLSAYLPLAGGTMTGPLILDHAPVAPLEAATKGYVDLFLPLSGGTVTGNLTVSGTTTVVTPPTADNSTKAATTAWVRLQSYATTAQLGNYLPLTGGTLSGPGNLQANGYFGVGATAPSDAVAGSLFASNPLTGTGASVLFQNAYNASSGTKLLTANPAAALNMGNGGFQFYGAPSAAAGTAPAWSLKAAIDISGNLSLSGNSLYFAGVATGNAGPRVLADTTNMGFELGTGNGSFYWYNNAGTGIAQLRNDGALFNNGQIWSGSDIVIPNNKGLWFKDASGNPQELMLLNSSNQLSFGYGTFPLWINGSSITLQGGPVVVSGEIQSTLGSGNYGGLRLVGGNYGAIFRQDGSYLYLLVTNSGNQYGGWNGLRPLQVSMADGSIYLGGPLVMTATSGPSAGIYPQTDNTNQCGSPGNAFAAMRSYAFNSASDRRHKQDIEPLPDCLDLVRHLVPQRWRWNHGADQETEHWGFVAQDVRVALDDAGLDFGAHIGGTDQAVNYQELTAVLWRAVQELAAEVAALKGAV